MTRPADWSAAGQFADPAPGDPWGVRALASTYATVASDASTAHTIVSAVQSSSGGGVWLGEAADAFHAKIGSFPSDIARCHDSYAQAADAISWWAGRMESAQSCADRGLAQAIQADLDLSRASNALSAARAQQHHAGAALFEAQLTAETYRVLPAPTWVHVPTATQLRQLGNASQTAAAAAVSAESSVDEAQQRLDAARRLVAEAQSEYQSDARTVVSRINAAKDAGITADNWWQKIYHSAAWSTIVKVVTVVAVVAAVAAIFLTGPVGLLVAGIAFGAGALMTANDAMAYGEGDESGGDLALSMAVMFVPGGKALRGVEDGARLFEAADKTATAATRAERVEAAANAVADNPALVRGTEDLERLDGLSAADRQAIIDLPKESRPDPSTYLSGEYIEKHLAQFDDGATRFMPKHNFDTYGIAQRDGTSFVMPKTQMDRLMSETGGDPRKMEQALGLPDGFLDKDSLVRVDIPAPGDYGLRIPSGREAGANAEWLPGGHLPTGISEGVVDGGSIPSSGFTTTVIGK